LALGYFLAFVSRGMRGRKPGFRNLVLWFSTKEASRALLTGFAILLMALSLVLTLSRSGIMGLALAVMLVATVMVKRQAGTSRRVVATGYLVFLVMAVVSWVGLDQIVARFGQVDLADINQRPAIWADTLRIVQDFWLTGTGLNTYGVSTLFYQTSVPGQHLREAHNDYLQLAAEGGLLLGVPILITIAAFCREVRRRLREDVGSIWWIRMGAVTGLLAIALQSTVEFSLQMPGNAALFAVIAGLAIHDGRRAAAPFAVPKGAYGA
jgi:O-antigen ligase